MVRGRPWRRAGTGWSRRPSVWWVLAGLYLVAALLSLLLAAAMTSWWPLVLVTGSVVAAAGCVTAGRGSRVGRTEDREHTR